MNETATAQRRSMVLERQEPLRQRYREAPEEALITDHAVTVDCEPDDAMHGYIEPGDDYGVKLRFGIHRAVGGFHDEPNPGDLLCAALAACQDSTVRMIADRLGVPLLGITTTVEGDVDVRGTLAVDPHVPVGFLRMRCRQAIKVPPGVDPELVKRVVAGAERACVVLNTLRNGVPVALEPQVLPAE